MCFKKQKSRVQGIISQQNLDFKHFLEAEMSLKEEESNTFKD